jgi:hypothetical protein
MATVRVRIAILTGRITLSVCPFNRMAHTANSGAAQPSGVGQQPQLLGLHRQLGRCQQQCICVGFAPFHDVNALGHLQRFGLIFAFLVHYSAIHCISIFFITVFQ